jgi:hypothetical protein
MSGAQLKAAEARTSFLLHGVGLGMIWPEKGIK